MANTLPSATILDGLSDQVMTTLGNRFAPLAAFSSSFSAEPMNVGKSVLVKKYTSTSAVQTNPTNFETGDTTADNVSVTLAHYSKSFHLTSAELNSSFELMKAVDINAQTVANKIIDVALGPVTATNFPSSVTVAQASFSVANVKSLWAFVAKSPRRHLFLDSVAYSQLLPSDRNAFVPSGTGAYGFDGIFLNTRWTGAGTNVYGFACGAEAIAVATRIPTKAPNASQAGLESRIVTLEGLGISVEVSTWFSLPTRSQWASIDLMFGAGLGDNTACARVISA